MKTVQKKLQELKIQILERENRQQPMLTNSRLFFSRFGFGYPLTRLKNLAIFIVGSALCIGAFAGISEISSGIHFSKKVLGEATIGLEFLEEQNIAAAREQFFRARQSIESSGEILVKAAQVSPLGQEMDELFAASTYILNALERLKQANFTDSLSLKWDIGANSSSQDFYVNLKQARQVWMTASDEIRAADEILASIPADVLPSDIRKKAKDGRQLLSDGLIGLDQAISFSDFVLTLLGGEKKTYLLVFQNNNEARATGGFIGTYGLLELGNGTLKINKIESIYALDGQLKEAIAAPGPMQRLVTPFWGMRDSNWFADFPTSSRKMLQFLEKESGVLAEGVISFTPDFFEEVLKLTGPVAMPEYGEVLTADNFRDVVQYKTSIDYDRQLNEPKKFLSDFTPKLLSKLQNFNEEQRVQFAQIFRKAVAEKHFMLFSLDPKLQERILDFNAAGNVKKTGGDYLSIVHSNVGGGKTDQGIAQSVDKTVEIDALGRQTVTLRITRSHEAMNEKYFPTNVDFMRVFVPEGSKIISVSGFDHAPMPASSRAGAATDTDLNFWDIGIRQDMNTKIYVGRESGYTVFMDWLILEQGQTKTVELKYQLPILNRRYSQLLQKQPGAREFQFTLKVRGIENPVFVYPEEWKTETVDEDRLYAVIGE
ncbi:MAG: hypothetical protein A3C85_01205 [Candidatus Doudnabacteria bacterium RIFCSPHIGHO2_02_FULL_48_21]|uniref:DUF4012 domain-containing protein n=1 Tax=Candidatus Doudnabacteria bacterium RIFCSPLOWO2_02_FULL_48_13 TaxID=1817845 RepID=A0A1F5Q9W1_9BACT|nr:MAG: hypothetical protein A3K05_04250 [Candidatus Doudnabacteria bacterium RIFCSPHIGHO2_01_48_18]OGE79575.1 MAG: hypothetical protein A2668_03260 [Candidatus Doudnabacteria bacterium RIFCSPHIGHO2_01_FULL_48_180]OGE91102.1 MAG: hypothetical protein A3F44_02145 [Candidatus Doudnabacteria bacterium RIFCSPHIGHO2_12_FULL_47_25]OGE93792.1 MAG: hypothetical protein A3C85_01205 [Candidatus Doudnabacteria bacterium RIFCSPHIGHO2_02_FULL_48_21]OGE97978.1 MAG: hypothetical protein A3A83_00790 [Candidatu